MPISEKCRDKADDYITLMMVVDAVGDAAFREHWAGALQNAKVIRNLAETPALDKIKLTLQAQAAEITNMIRQQEYARLLDILEPTRETIINTMLETVVECECKRE